jgi:hypothetical protein
MNVAVAHSTVRDLDLDFIRLQLAGIVLIGQQMRTGCVHSQTMYLTHLESFL